MVQEGRPVLVCHSLGHPVNLAPQGGLVDPPLTLLWVPETCHEQVNDCFYVTKMTRGVSIDTHHEAWSPREARSPWQPCLPLVSLLSFNALLTSGPLRLHAQEKTHKHTHSHKTGVRHIKAPRVKTRSEKKHEPYETYPACPGKKCDWNRGNRGGSFNHLEHLNKSQNILKTVLFSGWCFFV